MFDGVKHKLDLVHRFNEVSHLMAEPDQDMDKLMEEQAALMVRRGEGRDQGLAPHAWRGSGSHRVAERVERRARGGDRNGCAEMPAGGRGGISAVGW